MTDGTSVEFSDYGEILRRRWWIIAALCVVGIGLAIAALQVVPKTYSATALVQVKSVGETGAVANGRTSDAVNLDTEAQLVTSNDVAARAKDLLKSDESVRDLAKRVNVSVPANTSVLSIAFDADTAAGARDGAQAFATAYLANRKLATENDLASQIDTIRSQIKTLQQSLTESNKRIAKAQSGSAERADAQATSAALSKQIQDLSTQLSPLVGQDVNPGNIITAAQLPQGPSSPSRKMLLASGLAAGLLGGCLVAFVSARLDNRIRDRRDLERLGLDAMTDVVSVPATRDAGTAPASGDGAESLRQLRNALLAQMPGRSGSVIVANASDAEAGSAVSVSLAVTIARSGADVVLVSANTVHCAVEQAFEVPVQPGLVDVLRAQADLESAMLEVREIPHLRVIPAGADGSLASDLLQGPRVEAVIKELAQSADVVVVDVAPTSDNADAQTLVTASDGALLVATSMKTRRDEVLGAVDQLRHVSARVFGSVVVSVNRERRTSAPPKAASETPRGQHSVRDEPLNESSERASRMAARAS